MQNINQEILPSKLIEKLLLIQFIWHSAQHTSVLQRIKQQAKITECVQYRNNELKEQMLNCSCDYQPRFSPNGPSL
jgi:hypothetical protein